MQQNTINALVCFHRAGRIKLRSDDTIARFNSNPVGVKRRRRSNGWLNRPTDTHHHSDCRGVPGRGRLADNRYGQKIVLKGGCRLYPILSKKFKKIGEKTLNFDEKRRKKEYGELGPV